jgi:hypothetical protein
VTLEQRHYDLTSEVYKRLEDIQREVNVKAIESQADLDSSAKLIRREAAEQRREWEEAMKRLESTLLAKAEYSRPTSEGRTLDSSRPTTQGLRNFEPLTVIPVSDSPALIPSVKPVTAPAERQHEELGLRTPVDTKRTEQQIETTVPDFAILAESVKPSLSVSDQEKPAEINVHSVTREKEIKPKPARIPKPAKETSKGLALIMPEPPVNLAEAVQTEAESAAKTEDIYEPWLRNLEARITVLERPASSLSSRSLHKTLSRSGSIPSPTDLGEDLRVQHSAMVQELATLKAIYNSTVSARTSQPREDDLTGRVIQLEEQMMFLSESAKVAEACSKDVEKLKEICAAMEEELQAISSRPISAVSRLETSTQRVLSKAPSQQDVLGDVSTLLAEDRTAVSRISTQTQQDCQRRFQLQEKAILSLAQQIESLRKAAQTHMQDLESTQDLIKQVEKQSIQTQKTCEQELERITHAWDKEEEPETARSLVALRGVIGKMQREQRDLSSALAKLSVPDLPDNQGNYIALRLQRQETQVKHLTGLLQQVSEQSEAMQVQLRRQGESQTAARLAELEELRNEVGVVMRKASEGVRLSEKDVERLHELYDKIELKGDRAEVAQKVDRAELKKAYSSLTKKIESFREEVKRDLETDLKPSPEPAATTRRLDQECLSCGQEVPQAREERGIRRFGHGFSRLLPMLNSLAGSKQRALSTARLKSNSPY